MRTISILILALFCLSIAGTPRSRASMTQEGSIKGPSSVAERESHNFSYCKTDNFPYHYSWTASNDAAIEAQSVSGNCYLATVRFGSQNAFVTFSQSNPPGVPPVHNVTKYVTVKKKPA